MFEKFAKPVSKSTVRASIELPLSIGFLTEVVSSGLRLSYGAFAQAAKDLGENDSSQILAQRGSSLVKHIPVALQPHVCRKSGKYAKGVSWETETPEDLKSRPVITAEDVSGAVSEWLVAQEG